MSQPTRVFLCFVCLFCIIVLSSASDAIPNGFPLSKDSEHWINSQTALLLSFALCVSMVIVLAGCAFLCPCREQFKSINEENQFPGMDFPTMPRDVDLGIFPPVVNSPDRGPISFDPLPDVPTLMRHRLAAKSNVARVRPKVSHVVRDRLDSEEDVDGSLYRNSIQPKLDKLLTSNTKQHFQRNQLNYIKELGSGWFGKVLQGEGQGILPGHRRTSVVVQVLREDADKFDQYGFLQESAPYRDTEHTNVLKLLGQCTDTMPFLTVLELCINGDLKMYLRGQRSNVEIIDKQGVLLNFACDMAAGLQAMHQNNYVHRDFAIRNCLVTSDLTIKIGDYGLSEELYKDDYFLDSSGALIPIRWLAPEVMTVSNGNGLTLRHITKDCNLWSFGVALWELVTFGCLPYANLTNEQVLKFVAFEQSVHLSRPEIPISNLHRLFELMELCWLAPAQRPSLRELRIMLLHLQSSKDELDTQAFDQKWNQLLPRHSHIATIDSHDITLLHPDDDPEFYNSSGIMGSRNVFHTRDAVYPRQLDSRFSELDPSLVGLPGEFGSNMLSWTSFSAGSPDFNSRWDTKKFPTNELSLQAELGAQNFSSFRGLERDLPEEKDDFIFVTLPNESNVHKQPFQQIHHVAEVHRPSIDHTDTVSKRPLLNSNSNNKLTNSCEVSSSEDGFEELNREDFADKINGNAAVGSGAKGNPVVDPGKVRLSGNLEQLEGNETLKTNGCDTSEVSNDSESLTEANKLNVDDVFSVVNKSVTTSDAARRDTENNNTVEVFDHSLSALGE